MDLEDRAEERRAADEQDVRHHHHREPGREPVVPGHVDERHQREQDHFADDRKPEQDRAEQVHARGGKVVGRGIKTKD